MSVHGMMQAYSAPLSLWRLVEQYVPTTEQTEVKNMLGDYIVDQSLELHAEVNMLLDIWRELREEQKDDAESLQPLPEPPHQRERLIQEICFFVESVKEKAKYKGIDPECILRRHNADILDYATDTSRPGSSFGCSSRSSDGRETPMMPASPDRISVAFDVSDKVEAVNEKLNIDGFDQVCDHLRSTLEKEVEQLLLDIQFLQNCLDNEVDVRDCVTTPRTSRAPTLTELREERSSLEKELLATGTLTAAPTVKKPNFNMNNLVLPSTPPSSSELESSGQVARSGISETLSNTTRSNSVQSKEFQPRAANTPLKANHAIGLISFTDKAQPGPTKSASKSSIGSMALPSPPSGFSDSEIKQAASHSRLSPRQRGMDLKPSPPPSAVTKDGLVISAGSARRRTLSPGRVRVVDVTSIVDVSAGKRESGTEYSATSPPMPTFSPSPPTPAGERDPSLRPSSAHADRFRKMVMAYREGD